ncbi:MAG: hypothetical protein PG978_000756 [Wolbachia endosymbiont of Ctenocephalides felis wCfeF]|nr:MAG: hypothetical protein PG978_000756 [Wolbachia endosymbiont of Ctenocephalides felis wCfeF]
MADIWAKIGGAVKKGAGTTKDVLLLVPKALIYPIKKPFASFGEMKHDATVSLKEAVGMDVPEKEREYNPPIETTKASENLGIEIISYKDGKIKFLASRTLVGDVSHLSPKQLGQIKEVLPNIDVFREENKVIIEVDVEEITKGIKNASENKGKSPEEIKGLIIEQIKQKVDGDLKKLAKITGGELERHTDRKLLYGIAEKLYREYDGQDKSAEAKKSPEQPSETVKKEDFNITNPMGFPFGKETISSTKMQLPQGIKEQVKELGAFLNFDSDEAIKPLSELAKEEKEKVKGRG